MSYENINKATDDKLREAILRAEATKLFLQNRWMVYTPQADFDGVDLLVMNIDAGPGRTPEEVRKVQLKSRWTVDVKYRGKHIWMCFQIRINGTAAHTIRWLNSVKNWA